MVKCVDHTTHGSNEAQAFLPGCMACPGPMCHFDAHGGHVYQQGGWSPANAYSLLMRANKLSLSMSCLHMCAHIITKSFIKSIIYGLVGGKL